MGIALLVYGIYTLGACWLLSRLDWTRRSVAVGGVSWLGWPTAALGGLLIPVLVTLLHLRSVGLTAGITAVLSGLSAAAMVRAAMAGQDYRPQDSSPALWFLLFRLALVPVAVPIFWLLLKSNSWTGSIASIMLWLIFYPNVGARLYLRLALGRGHYTALPEAPLTGELARVLDRPEEKTELYRPLRYRVDEAPSSGGRRSGFGVALIRSLRWQDSRSSVWNHIPIEFVRNLSSESLTAAVAFQAHGWEYGFNFWKRAATVDDPPRTIPAFFRALAEFDRFLLQPVDPGLLIRRYEESWQLKWIARKHGTEEDYAQALAEVRRVLTTGGADLQKDRLPLE